jgi:hypothetical protein
MVWLIDCWSVHISKDFRAWIKRNHPKIHLLFIPANCTSIFQPADVILQRHFKHAFRQEFHKFTMDIITSQLQGARDIKVDTKMSILKPQICGWLFTTWHHLTIKSDMVEKKWKHIGLLQAFETNFQKEAMIDNIKTPLFKSTEEDTEIETINNIEDEDTCNLEVSLDTVLEDSLTKVALLNKSNTSSLAALHGMARSSKSAPYNILR